jgi:hypothetical protein
MSELADLAGVPPSANMLTTAETKRFLMDTGFMHYNDVMGRCGFGDIFEIAKMNEIQRFEFFGEIGIQSRQVLPVKGRSCALKRKLAHKGNSCLTWDRHLPKMG